MSKTSNALLMLFYLNNKNTYTKISEIADYLEVSNREVRRYRDNLEMAGFSIENKTGRYGGYLLIDDLVFSMNLNHMKHVLSLLKRNDSMYDINQNLMNDIIDSLKNERYISNHLLPKEIIDKLVQINVAIKLKYKIEIEYVSSKGYRVKQLIEPYMIKNVRDIQYLFALHKGVLKSYSVQNILDIRQTDLAYMINHDIYQKEINEYAYGIHRGETKYTIHFSVMGRMKDYVKDIFKGHARVIDEEKAIFEIDTYDLHEITYPFLSLGASLRIISPQAFKDHYLEELEKIKKNL
jgi:predicted DNA-binding transcriptional regulator YafY